MPRYTIKAKKTGAVYPHFAPTLGPGWQFILSYPGERERAFSCHKMARAFAERLASRIPA